MRIGLTYDLRQEYLAAGFSPDETAEFDRVETVDSLEQALTQLGHTVERIGHGRQLISALESGHDWDLVFNIAEGLSGIAREAQIPAILDLYGIAYTFSDPLVMALSLHKALTKTVVAASGVATPDFCLVTSASEVDRVRLPYPLFAKPLAEGTGKGVSPASKVSDAHSLRQVCGNLLERYQQPVLVETFLSGREFTTGILGTGEQARVLATMEVLLRKEAEADAYSYVNKENCEQLVDYRLVLPEHDEQVRAAQAVALTAWRALGCRDAGRIDLRCDALGHPNFIEVNPLAGLHPEHSDLPILAAKVGVSFLELIRQIVDSATPRVAAARHSKARRFRTKS